ncbi:MAG: flotillin-like FloA family protein, partial [Verrucomicrobia bacterium]|nr:flotillin-like FloA family protein [Verrucomicrobiota bacterium]
VAMEHENSAKVREMQSKVVEAEAQIPMAIAESFRSGNLGIMDFYRMKNIQADTDMRRSISKDDDMGHK